MKGVEVELDVTSGEYMSDNDSNMKSMERKVQCEVQLGKKGTIL
jgi:hypothetical protein